MDYRIAAVYDTETTTVGTGADSVAFPCLYIFNDLRGLGTLRDYEPGCKGEDIRFMRDQAEALAYVLELVDWGIGAGCAPVICAYNLMFDLQPILYDLCQLFEVEANAQSATNAYTVDLMEDGKALLRFWDAFHLEMGGLRAMGETCGLPKADGDWDYSLVRHHLTPLTEAEVGYASRDVQVIPAYLRYVLEANPNLEDGDLGVRVLTKTSIVRQMARSEVHGLRFPKADGSIMKVGYAYERTCEAEAARSYHQYALRKACFRGGFTFTAARYANQVQERVASYDVTSMHHLFINGRYVPVGFREASPKVLQAAARSILAVPIPELLRSYHHPFLACFHGVFRFRGLRLRGWFREWGIALAPSHRLSRRAEDPELMGNAGNIAAEEGIRAAGYLDSARGASVAFGKLMAAEEAVLHLNEVELYAMGLSYEWDSLEALGGELSLKSVIPPDYVTAQSNLLFERKQDAKLVSQEYREGEPYPGEVPASIPEGIAAQLREGTCSAAFFGAWYQSTVKGQFNGIYGTMAQDVYKPGYLVEDGVLEVDAATVASEDNWEDIQPRHNRVLYTYGMRIVGGSRLHLALAVHMIGEAFQGRARVLGGDTDSLKVALPPDVSPEGVLDALEPLHKAADSAIGRTMARLRRCFPDLASGLEGVGRFDYEGTAELHMEAWNKARVYMKGGKPGITAAGLSRPRDRYHIVDWMEAMEPTLGFERMAQAVLGYNTAIDNSVCHALQRTSPDPGSRFTGEVTDYLGNAAEVDAPQSIALYPASRELGDTCKASNLQNAAYLAADGRPPDTAHKDIGCDYLDGGEVRPWLRWWEAGERWEVSPDGVLRLE